MIKQGWRPQVIFMDVMMPVMDGTTAIHKLKENPGTAEIPIVAMSAAPTLRRRTDRLAEADAVLPKPFSIDDLDAACQFWLKKGGAT
jgi:CheY-like chemotaxis protein